MRAIIVGAGGVGRQVAAALIRERHEVVMVERDAARLEPLQERLDAQLVAANGASPHVLRDLGAADTDLMVAATGSDETNLVASLVARDLGTRRTVVRLHGEDYLEPGKGLGEDVFGADLAVHPERLAAESVTDATRLPGAAWAREFSEGRVTVAHVAVPEGAPAIGRSPAETVGGLGVVLGGVRGDRALMPASDETVCAGDRLLVATARGDARAAVVRLVGTRPDVEAAVVVGGGLVGLETAARLLEAGVRVTILDGREARARRAAERLPQAIVRHERALGGDQFDATTLGDADAFIACTEDDQTNLVLAFTAHRRGCDMAIPVIRRQELEPVVRELGLDSMISPHLPATARVLGMVGGTWVVRAEPVTGAVSLVELRVSEDARLNGRRLRDAALPRGAEIAAVVRDDRVLEPDGELMLREGDRALVLLAEVDLGEVLTALGD